MDCVCTTLVKSREVLVDQSDGLFIYVATLVKFIGDGGTYEC
jgi:hypothetical protein